MYTKRVGEWRYNPSIAETTDPPACQRDNTVTAIIFPNVTSQPLSPPILSSAASVPMSLKERMVRASLWSFFAYGCSLVLRLGSSVVMTRLLAPEAFGLVALVFSITMIASLMSDVGIRQGIVHSPHGDDPQMLDTAWTMQILRGIWIWIVCIMTALSLFVAADFGFLESGSVYAAAELPILIAISGLGSVISGFETTKRYTADRRIDQSRIVLIELASLLIGLIVTIFLGWLIRSVWAIVVGSLSSALISVLAGHLLLSGHTNRLAWNSEFARKIFRFGKWILASSLMYVLSVNADKLMLGMWVTPAVLGCYAIGQNVARVLEVAVGRVLGQVVSPAFADVALRSPQRLREVYLRLRLPCDLILVISAGFIYAVGPGLVRVMYDARYAEAGHILQLLSFSLIFARYGIAASVYLALQAPHAQAVMNLARMAVFFVATPLAHSTLGLYGAYWAIALHGMAVAPVVWWFDHRYGLLSWRHEALPLVVWPLGWFLGSALAGR